MKLSNKVYDVLKWCCMLFLPALATFVRIIFSIWSLSYGEEISNTIVAVNALLAACLGISSVQYHTTEKDD